MRVYERLTIICSTRSSVQSLIRLVGAHVAEHQRVVCSRAWGQLCRAHLLHCILCYLCQATAGCIEQHPAERNTNTHM